MITALHRIPRPALIAAVALLVALLAGCAGDESSRAPDPAPGEAHPASPAPRNVIFIVIDALRADHLGALGYERDTTPNLDRFARDSLLFTRAYSAASWTLPSLASYMTSVYPEIHGLRRPPTEADHFALPQEFVTLAESFRGLGFRTASITSQPWLSDRTGLTQGFQEARSVSHASAPGEARVLTDELIAWLRANGESRFFLYAHYMGPHSPYDVPSEHSGRFTAGRAVPPTVAEFHRIYEFESEADAYRQVAERAKAGGLTELDIEYMKAEYDEKLAFTDECLGRLLETLRRSGRFEDSVIIVTADHGEAFYEHGTIFHGQGLYEELIRVPLILHLPGAPFPPARIDEVVELIDLYPTLHDLIGAPAPPYIQGRSLLPIIRGGPSDGVAFAEYYGFKVVTPGWSSFYEYSDTLHLESGYRVSDLYDLRSDPEERSNLAGQAPGAARRQLEVALRIWNDMDETRQRLAVSHEAAVLDEETKERLRSLGYLGGSR